MCGICGFITKKNIGVEVLNQMNNTMETRGPDDSGVELFSVGNERFSVGLAQRRLSIVDLSDNGHQPFFSKGKDIGIVFNGEIYNYKKLKEDLSGYEFISDCDTEVIIAAYEKWGKSFVHYIDGMFAIAIFDKRTNELILARDRMGKKPLYYYRDQNSFVFGSVLQPIINFPGFKKEIDKDVIPRFLYNRYISEDRCIFKNVSKVKPGELIVINEHGDITKDIYWDLLKQYYRNCSTQIKEYHEAKACMKEVLTESVRRRMIADVPVGAFLSGGYDSSLVTAIAQTLTEEPLKTFSIGFEDENYDEAPYAIEVAKWLGTDHTNYYVSEREMLELVESIPKCYDEPFADSSQIPTMLVSRIAREDVTVVLTGDGGDELFCGYNMYDKLELAQKIEPFAKVLRIIFNEKGRAYNKFPFSVRAILENSNINTKTQLGRELYKDNISRMLGCDKTAIPYDESEIHVKKWQIKRMLLDCITYLPDNNLCKVDRATMNYSLEARNPILDVSVLNMAFRTPHKYKYYKKEKKYILKDITYDFIPKELLERPKKGFSVPIDKWLRGPLKEELIKVTSKEYLQKQGIFEAEYTSMFVLNYIEEGDKGAFSGNNPSNLVWPLYMFQKWYQYYME